MVERGPQFSFCQDVNRSLQAMRRKELTTFKGGRLTVLDLPRLKKIATFKPNYLHLGRRSAA